MHELYPSLYSIFTAVLIKFFYHEGHLLVFKLFTHLVINYFLYYFKMVKTDESLLLKVYLFTVFIFSIQPLINSSVVATYSLLIFL